MGGVNRSAIILRKVFEDKMHVIDEYKSEISKIEGARRLIHAATRMVYESEDALAVNLLVQSANQVLTDLTAYYGIDDVLLDSSIVKAGQKENVRSLFKLHSNFVKHSDREPDSTLRIFDIGKFSEVGLFFAILRYRQFALQITTHMKFYLGYYLMRNPTHGQMEDTLSEDLAKLGATEANILKIRKFWAMSALKNSNYCTEKSADCSDVLEQIEQKV